ncbi:MAG TPA: cyclase family protein [Caldilineaceae bacterium]|nr:cyclase family protein [Caldilineaceae bacterium]HRW07040.1 cyclase family protein [Caldilineaceae bacterium]
MCPPSFFELLHSSTFLEQAADRAVGGPPSVPPATGSTPMTVHHAVDLTHALSPTSPVFPGLPAFVVEKPLFTHEANNVSINRYTVTDHCGTHFDAPYHVYAGGLKTDEVDPAALVVPAVVINISARAANEHATRVTPDDLLAWERQHGRIPHGAAVLMNAGWATRIDSAAAYINADDSGTFHFPGFSVEAAEFLLHERAINGIGVDTLSLDHGPATDFAVHMAFLPTNRWGLECLANLDKIPPSGAYLFVGVPKIKGSSGGPTRVMAVW